MAVMTLTSFAAYQGLTMDKVQAADPYNVTFTGTLCPDTVNVRTGPGTNYSTAFTMAGNSSVTFSGIEYGTLINDYWTGHADPRWYYFYQNGTKYYVASALVNGNPAAANIRAKDRAIAWSVNQEGSTAYDGYCEAFVEYAYGTGYIYGSAIADSNANNTYGSLSTAPIGSLIYFKADASNGYYGHVGIY
ncbi:MAG: SH3 domain-containing protein, partial [Tumebacillaceae bacterium]